MQFKIVLHIIQRTREASTVNVRSAYTDDAS